MFIVVVVVGGGGGGGSGGGGQSVSGWSCIEMHLFVCCSFLH
jgi:hypothetical protein